MATAEQALAMVLALAKSAREAERSPKWKLDDIEPAIEEHGEACDALWEYLYLLLDAEKPGELPEPFSILKERARIRKQEREEIISHLTRRIGQFARDSLRDYDKKMGNPTP